MIDKMINNSVLWPMVYRAACGQLFIKGVYAEIKHQNILFMSLVSSDIIYIYMVVLLYAWCMCI